MTAFYKSIHFFAAAVLFFGCASNSKRSEMDVDKPGYGNTSSKLNLISANADSSVVNDLAKADSVSSNGFISSSAAKENGRDTSRRFIRTAEMKFKVKSVIHSTYAIEAIVKHMGGYVAQTNLSSEKQGTDVTAVSADSSLETTYFIVNNHLTVRVPNKKLDTTLKQIARWIDFLDYRNIKADDVALMLLKNNLIQKRSAKNEGRLTNAIDAKGKKLGETVMTEEMVLRRQEQADDAKVEYLSLSDQIKFSTIALDIYQRRTLKREMVSNDKNMDAYEPGFGSKFVASIKTGWHALEEIVLFFAKIWWLILLVMSGLFVFRKYGSKLKK